MLLAVFAAGFVGVLIGLMIERYKWVRAAKNSKFIEVDGDLYTIGEERYGRRKKTK
jgi:hypothetical protein